MESERPPEPKRQRHYRNHLPGGSLAFITSTCLDFSHLFVRPEICHLLLSEVVEASRIQAVQLHAYVIMSHHVHLLAMLPEGLHASSWVGRWKSLGARAILPRLNAAELEQLAMQCGLDQRQMWMRSYRGYKVVGDQVRSQKVNYIHNNPVRSGKLQDPTQYQFSSARLHQQGLCDRNTGLALDLVLADVRGWRG